MSNVGKPMTIRPSVFVYKIAKLDDKENTITLNFMLSISWRDTRISMESNDPNESEVWYELSELDQSFVYNPSLIIGGTKTIRRTSKYGATDKDYYW